ncbi:MAG: hypothetical protein Q4B88_04690 [Moraxella sp.]|nr:hypothetical protein [Moraxella sp.]
MSQTEETETDNGILDLEDWSKKYDVTLTALSQEYWDYTNMVRQVDEKANKYLVILSIFVAGFFSIIASSLTDKLSFDTTPLTGISLLSWCFVICAVVCGIYGFLVIKGFLKSLEYVSTVRLPNLEQELHNTGSMNHVEYKHHLIQRYQTAIGILNQARADKQTKLKNVIHNVPYFLLSMVSSVIILFVIKLVSK